MSVKTITLSGIGGHVTVYEDGAEAARFPKTGTGIFYAIKVCESLYEANYADALDTSMVVWFSDKDMGLFTSCVMQLADGSHMKFALAQSILEKAGMK